MPRHLSLYLLLKMAAFLSLHVLGAAEFSFSKAHGLEGRLEGVVLQILTGASLVYCHSVCRSYVGCKAFNRQKNLKKCELLSSRLCEGDLMTLTQAEPGWRFYDLHDDTYPDPNHIFYNSTVCVERGMCSTACERYLDQSCFESIQCQAVTEFSHCTATSSNVLGTCVCDTNAWKYNASICIHKTSMDSPIYTWIFKKIVNVCSVTFTARVRREIRFHLVDREDWMSGNTNYYIIIGGWDNSQSILDRSGTRLVTASTPSILTNNYQNFTFQWCNGQIRLAQQGQANFIAYDDPSPFTILTLGFQMPYPDAPPNDHAHIFFPEGLVDTYYPTSEETGVIRTNGYHWIEYKILPDAGSVSAINFTFECKAPKDCYALFAHKNDHSRKFQVFLGAHYNGRNLLDDGRVGRVIDLAQPDTVSATEFRKFWIHVDGPSIVVGKGSEDTVPLFSYTDTGESTRTFSHVAIATCCGDFGYWKIHSHPQFHEYPNGAYRL